MCQRGFQPKVCLIFEQSSLRKFASCGPPTKWFSQRAFAPQTRQNKSVSEAEAGYDVLGTLKLSERTVEDSMVCEQIERDVRALVELLPSEQREVVIMRYFSGLSFKEIAEQTDVSINTALGRMRYALINLRRMIKEKNLILS